LPAMAADLVQRQVNVISAPGVPAVRAAKAATSAIPIVFGLGVDPVALGLVASLSRPGGNVTGVSTLGGELGAKRLALIHETVPGASLIGALINPTNPSGDSQRKELQAVAQVLGVRLEIMPASTDHDLDGVFASLRAARARALVIGNDGFLLSREKQLAALALRHSIPAIFQFRGFVTAGGLMSYGTDRTEEWHLHGIYVSRILNGEKPADLPVQQAVKVELVINLKTAKALGLTIPETLLATANEVIE
jgi:putative tryptophan/tyrosine transport system substrate-binding protein